MLRCDKCSLSVSTTVFKATRQGMTMTMSSSSPYVPISKSLWILLTNDKILEASIMTRYKNNFKNLVFMSMGVWKKSLF